MKNILFLLSFFLLIIHSNASNYFWVNGTGNWSDFANHWSTTSGGSVFHVQPPTPFDDVFFNINSFSANDTLYVDSTVINCRNLDFTGVANSIFLKNVGGNTTIDIYGSFIIHGGVRWNQNPQLNFKSDSTGNIINTSGSQLRADNNQYPGFNFTGSGSWDLQNDLVLDSLNVPSISGGIVSVNNGTFFSNGYTILCEGFSASTFSNVLLGTSVIYCEGFQGSNNQLDADSTMIYCGYNFFGGNNVTYNDVTAHSIEQSDGCSFHDVTAQLLYGVNNSDFNNVILDGGIVSSVNNTFNKVTVISSQASIRGNHSYDTLIFSNPGMIIELEDTQTINNFLQADGSCSGLTVLKSGTNGTISKSSGTVTLNYVLLQNITGMGGAVYTANNSINDGNVNGITINSPAPGNLYWVGGAGDWSDVSHWATSSGGTGGSCVPSPADNVFFDANSFTSAGDTLKIDQHVYCKTMDWSGVLNNPLIDGSSTINIYGSFIIHGGVRWNRNPKLNFKSDSTGNIINTSGSQLRADNNQYPGFNFTGSGSWDLQNDLVLDSLNVPSISGGNVSVNNGTFFSNGYTILCEGFSAGTFSNVLLGTSVIYCEGWQGSNNQLDADSTMIYCGYNFFGGNNVTYNDVTAHSIEQSDGCSFHDVTAQLLYGVNNSDFNNVILDGGIVSSVNNTFNKVTVISSQASIRGNHSYDTLIFSNPGMIIELEDTQTINNFLQADGSCSGLTVLKSGTNGTISKSSGTVTLNYVLLQNITGMGGAVYTANNSINDGNVNGITINSPAPGNLYWVGGAGDWSDVSHWATSSGGTGGSCVPSPADNVFFDANSFTSAGDTLKIDQHVYCKTMDWSGVLNNPLIDGSSTINIYGSFIIHGGVRWNQNPQLNFKSATTGNIINTSGSQLRANNDLYPRFNFTGSGSWDLQNDLVLDSLNVPSISGGNVSVNNGTFFSNGYTILCEGFSAGTFSNVLLGTSVIYCEGWQGSNNQLDADSTMIYCGYNFFGGNNVTYNDVTAHSIEQSDGCSFHDVTAQLLYGVNNSDFNNVILDGGIVSSVNNTFNKVTVISSQTSIKGNHSYDTLIFNNPGMIIELEDTQTINNTIIINSDPGFPVSFHGPAVINFSDSVCTDFIYLEDITATGVGVFYAGIHSVDLGGNSGWLFSSCAPVFSNVWPGDANYDLIVNNIDLLYIGVAYGDTGFVRSGATNNYVAQPCQDWFSQFINGTNVKKADSDGNGLIDALDTTAVSLNYGLSHPFRLPYINETNNQGTELILQIPPGQAIPGSILSIPILLGTNSNPANNVYGIAFTVNYDNSMIDPGTLSLDFNGSWIEPGTNHLNLTKDFSSAGKCDAAFTRIDGNNVSGNGIIANLNFQVSNAATGYLHISLSKIKLISHNEIEIPVFSHADSVFTNISENSSGRFSVYPNPSSGKVFIQLKNNNYDKCRINIFNSLGQIVFSEVSSQNKIELKSEFFIPGIYSLVIKFQDGKSESCKIIFY